MTTFQVLLVNNKGEIVADYLTNEVVHPNGPVMLAGVLAGRIRRCLRRHAIDTVKVRKLRDKTCNWFWYTCSIDGTTSGVELCK